HGMREPRVGAIPFSGALDALHAAPVGPADHARIEACPVVLPPPLHQLLARVATRLVLPGQVFPAERDVVTHDEVGWAREPAWKVDPVTTAPAQVHRNSRALPR